MCQTQSAGLLLSEEQRQDRQLDILPLLYLFLIFLTCSPAFCWTSSLFPRLFRTAFLSLFVYILSEIHPTQHFIIYSYIYYILCFHVLYF